MPQTANTVTVLHQTMDRLRGLMLCSKDASQINEYGRLIKEMESVTAVVNAGVVRPVEDLASCLICRDPIADQPHLHVITTPCCGKRCHEMCLAKHYLEHEEEYRVCPVCHGIDELSCRPVEWRVGRRRRQELIQLDLIEEVAHKPSNPTRANPNTDGVWVWKASNVERHCMVGPVSTSRLSADTFVESLRRDFTQCTDEEWELKQKFSKYWVN